MLKFSSILVGAPRTNGSVYEQGALYQCSKVSNEFSCRTIPTKGSGKFHQGVKYIFIKFKI